MEGNERKMNGHERKMEGNERKMEGNERKMNRHERKMEGNERKMEGNERNMNGNERKMEGNERNMEGNERNMNGNERKMEGNERNMEGNERKMNGNERKMNVFLRVIARHDVKIDVSCEASFDFHHMSPNATPATEFAPWHHFAQRWQCDSQKNTEHEAARWCKSIAPATQNRRGRAQKTRFGATSRSRDKAISVVGRKSRKTQKTHPRASRLAGN